MDKQQAWQPPPPPPPPPYTPPPSYSSPPPYSQPPRSGEPRPRLRRSRSDRRIAGVAGGLGEYLGVDATALRVGFVIASILFLGGLGGPVLYVIAWILVPEEGKDAPVTRAAFSGRVWHDWDRTARSWALVLGALALALIWSFGLWPWWHWRTLPLWLIGLALALWILARHREGNWGVGSSGTGHPVGPGGPVNPPGGSPVATPGGAPVVPPPVATDPSTQPGQANQPGQGGRVSPVTPITPYETGPYEGDLPPAAAHTGTPAASNYGTTVNGFGMPAGPDIATASTAVAAGAGALAGGSSDAPGPESDPAAADGGGTAGPDATGGGANPSAPALASGSPSTSYSPYAPYSSPATSGALVTTNTGALSPTPQLGPRDSSDLAAADWAEAKTAAAYWAADQLAQAGVPSPSSAGPAAGPTAPAGTGTLTHKQTAARRLRRAARVLIALIAALLLLAVMTVVGVTLGTGSSLSGGAGNSTYVPLNAEAVQANYRLGAGDLNVNLTQVNFPASGQIVDMTVGLGNLTIEVPKDAVVDVHARSGIGQVDVFGQTGSNITATEYGGSGKGSNAPRLTVDAHVGIGNLQVSQG
jgi:phage shock protein PspC (stress-responsive transcriptional regulator)